MYKKVSEILRMFCEIRLQTCREVHSMCWPSRTLTHRWRVHAEATEQPNNGCTVRSALHAYSTRSIKSTPQSPVQFSESDYVCHKHLHFKTFSSSHRGQWNQRRVSRNRLSLASQTMLHNINSSTITVVADAWIG